MPDQPLDPKKEHIQADLAKYPLPPEFDAWGPDLAAQLDKAKRHLEYLTAAKVGILRQLEQGDPNATAQLDQVNRDLENARETLRLLEAQRGQQN